MYFSIFTFWQFQQVITQKDMLKVRTKYCVKKARVSKYDCNVDEDKNKIVDFEEQYGNSRNLIFEIT